MASVVDVSDAYEVTLENFDKSTLVFGKLTESKAGSGMFRVPIKRINSRGKQVSLVIRGPEDLENDAPETWCHCFGIKKFGGDSKKNEKLSHSVGIALFARDGATPFQRKWLKDFNDKIVAPCQEQAISAMEELSDKTWYRELTPKTKIFSDGGFSHIKFPPKKDVQGKAIKGEVIDAPSMYLRMIEPSSEMDEKSEKRKFFVSKFLKWDEKIADTTGEFDEYKDPIIELPEGTMFKAKFTFRVESIYIDKTYVSMKLALASALVSPIKGGNNRHFVTGKRKKTGILTEENLVTGCSAAGTVVLSENVADSGGEAEPEPEEPQPESDKEQ